MLLALGISWPDSEHKDESQISRTAKQKPRNLDLCWLEVTTPLMARVKQQIKLYFIEVHIFSDLALLAVKPNFQNPILLNHFKLRWQANQRNP